MILCLLVQELCTKKAKKKLCILLFLPMYKCYYIMERDIDWNHCITIALITFTKVSIMTTVEWSFIMYGVLFTAKNNLPSTERSEKPIFRPIALSFYKEKIKSWLSFKEIYLIQSKNTNFIDENESSSSLHKIEILIFSYCTFNLKHLKIPFLLL